MNLDFLQHQKMLHSYSFLKKEHFVPSVQRDDFASGVDNLVRTSHSFNENQPMPKKELPKDFL